MKESKKIAFNISWIMLGRVFQLGLTFICTMFMARYLGPTEMGKMNYVYSYVQLFIPICQMGLNSTVVKELSDNKDNNGEVLGTIILIRIFGSLIAMFCSTSLVYFLNGKQEYLVIAILQSFSLLFQAFDCLMYFYQYKFISKKSGIVYAVSYVLTTIFRIIGVLLNKDVKWFSFAISLDYIVIAILLYIVYKKDKNEFKFSFKMAKCLLKNSYHYILAGILVVIYGKVTDILFLGKLVDETAVGYYTAATNLCNAWPFILTAIIDSFSPIIIDLYDLDKEKFYKKIKQLYAIVFYISIFAGIGITLLAKPIIYILYGKSYMDAVSPLRIACWSTAFSYIGVARFIWLQCENKNKYETIISLFGAIVNVILNYTLIKAYDINGAALALTLTQFLTNFVFLFLMKETRENAKLIKDAILLKGVLNKEDSSNV